MKKVYMLLTLSLSLLFAACNKSEAPVPEMPGSPAITIVEGPSPEGVVTFQTTADKAKTYIYDFGDGTTQTVPSGIVTHTYTASGSYAVTVTAKGNRGGSSQAAQQVEVALSRKLLWSDEFDKNGPPDPSKWGYDIGTGENGWGNNESQYYTNRTDNAVVSDGTLKIKLKAEDYNGSRYTSARLLSKKKFEFKYGRVEVRAKLTTGGGTWPAIWMLGSNFETAGWPACGEIDIMEYKGNEPANLYGTFHYPGRAGGNADGGKTQVSNANTEFHVYAVDWTAEVIKISVDGKVFHELANGSNLPFNQNFFIILNVAIGGNFGGAIDPAFVSTQMEVDYVRVYK